MKPWQDREHRGLMLWTMLSWTGKPRCSMVHAVSEGQHGTAAAWAAACSLSGLSVGRMEDMHSWMESRCKRLAFDMPAPGFARVIVLKLCRSPLSIFVASCSHCRPPQTHSILSSLQRSTARRIGVHYVLVVVSTLIFVGCHPVVVVLRRQSYSRCSWLPQSSTAAAWA